MLYLPYADFRTSAQALKATDLRNQVIQVVDLMETLHETDKAKKNPDYRLVGMWQGYEPQLCQYGFVMLEELSKRIPNNTVSRSIVNRLEWHLECSTEGQFEMGKPPWIGNEAIHRSHRSVLIVKEPQYAVAFPDAPDDLPLVWPE